MHRQREDEVLRILDLGTRRRNDSLLLIMLFNKDD
jgi:hypothetical protein